MSSTYPILCLSHDPAIIAHDPGWNRPEQAEEAIRAGVQGHEDCDLMIGRYSYPLVELGCPATCKYHGHTEWTDREWLILLAAAYQSDDPAVRQAAKDGHHHCLSWDRLRRLRVELGITVAEPEPDEKPTSDDSSATVERVRAFEARLWQVDSLRTRVESAVCHEIANDLRSILGPPREQP